MATTKIPARDFTIEIDAEYPGTPAWTPIGGLNSLIGAGMIIASQMLPRLARRASHEWLVLCGLGGMGIAVFTTAAFGKLAVTVATMLGLGFFAAFVMIPSQTLLQRETPQEMLGRVSSSLMSLMAISQVLAMFAAGPVAQSAGIRNLYFGSAAMLVAIASIGAWLLQARRGAGPRPAAASQAASSEE